MSGVLTMAGSHRKPILLALPFPHHNLIGVEVDILDAEPKTLQETKAGTIEQGGHNPVAALKRTQQHFHFLG
jgi:hypothetical protein